MIKGLVLALGLAALTLPSAATASDLYLSGSAGVLFASDADNIDNTGFKMPSSFDLGVGFSGAIGAWIAPLVRVEGEFSYRQSGVDSFDVLGFEVSGGGEIETMAGMANAFIDFDLAPVIHPYVGGGVGIASVSANNIDVGGALLSDDDDTVFAYQLIGGVGFGIAPNLSLTLDYRYFATADPEWAIAGGGGSFDSEYETHNVMAGLRLEF